MKKLTLLVLLMAITLTLTGCKKEPVDPVYDDVYFYLAGDDEIFLTEGETYEEPGFTAKDNRKDISDDVYVTSVLDTDSPGIYTLLYTLDYLDKETTISRKVYVQYYNSGCTVVEDTTTYECVRTWDDYLHTFISLKINFEQTSIINANYVFSEVERIISLYDDISDKYTVTEGNVGFINENPTDTTTITEELFDLIDFTITNQASVNNLFNMALGPVLQIWHDYREACTFGSTDCDIPTTEELEAADQFTDPSKIVLDRENLTITMEEGMSIDLGGVSKGYISRLLVDLLDGFNLSGYLLNNGESNISVGGINAKKESGNYLIAVTDPNYIKPYFATVILTDGLQFVTSGDYQQYFYSDGQLYHHIIHPDTLMPAYYCRSVSVVYDDAALADLYSTALFNMTIEEGILFVDNIPGLEAIWYANDDAIHYSENFEAQYLNSLH